MPRNMQTNSTLARSARPYYLSKSKPRTKFASVASYDRGTLYERALKKQEVQKVKMESAVEREEREIAACSFKPDLCKSMLSYQGSRVSPSRRSFAELYTHLMQPIMNKATFIEQQSNREEELLIDLKK